MKKIAFHSDWKVVSSRNGEGTDYLLEKMDTDQRLLKNGLIHLPHDGMILEKRTPDTKNSSHSGFYPGNTYVYSKKFFVPEEWRNNIVLIEFEGVYANALVYLNGALAANRPYGYSDFYVETDGFLTYGEENEIKVIAKNSMEETGRWYTGGGIYRGVSLHVGERTCIIPDGLWITTPEVSEESALVRLDLILEHRQWDKRRLNVVAELTDPDGMVVEQGQSVITVFPKEENHLRMNISVEQPLLWDCDHPHLYRCRVSVMEQGTVVDCVEEEFGIRSLSLDSRRGLRINGKETKLRGACIHHDHGVIGVVSLYRAEERRIRQLKEAGFNCIRSSHHPAGKTLLRVCDREGMLVMDEAFDVWTVSKNENDYALYFRDWWERDLESMVKKDRNHPSVILYSVGNEIVEIASPAGCRLNRKLTDKIRSLDPYRYVTNAVNGLAAVSDELDEILFDIEAKYGKEIFRLHGETAADSGGSNELNRLMSLIAGPAADVFMNHPRVAEILEEVFCGVDLAGMNYMTAFHETSRTVFPHRAVLGTETFPADIGNLWRIVKENSHVIGDMTWAGYDYIGEAGCGVYHYEGGQNFTPNWPDRLAYIGDIDLIGNRRPISYLREIVYGLRKEPYIAVGRLDKAGKRCDMTPWMRRDEVASWTWPGFEGKKAAVCVFSPSEMVKLYLNGVMLGCKAAGEENGYIAEFEVEYRPGTLEAVGVSGNETDGRFELRTADREGELCAESDRTQLRADGEDLAYITVSLQDQHGTVNPWDTKRIAITVEGAGKLAGFGSAAPRSLGNYFDTECDTYDGYVLAVIRSGVEEGEITVTVSSEGLKEQQVILHTEKGGEIR